MPSAPLRLSAKDFKSDQEVRWCPGCGDYAILAAMQGFLPELGIPRERIVFVSGIGCSSRFPYYLNTYGMHSIHGRAPAIATGLSVSRPDLQVWVVTGDGDALSIGGNHLIHALRRNVNVKILLFNNKIYGLTKGQYSPTSEIGKVTKSTPAGSADYPFNPISLALGAEASFVARTIDSDRKHLTSVLRAADGAFDVLKEAETRDDYLIRLEHGQPLTFGTQGRFAVTHPAGSFGLTVQNASEVDPAEVLVHDAHTEDPAYAFALSRLAGPDLRYTPVGIFRSVRRSSYDELVRGQVGKAKEKSSGDPDQDLAALLNSGDTWTIL
jgi:2-oxoglutarate/2-oxoacid ferredoxin oxidoreductase subunit beta